MLKMYLLAGSDLHFRDIYASLLEGPGEFGILKICSLSPVPSESAEELEG